MAAACRPSRRTCSARVGSSAVETPAIEQLDVFVHGIGQSTDVVRKEMFRVFSGANFARVLEEGTDSKLKAKQRLALRPEGTAGVVRAVVENNLVPQGAAPFKGWYAEAMFRGERPQKGRLRQFHQVGIEWLGAPDPAADAECIIMLMELLQTPGIRPVPAAPAHQLDGRPRMPPRVPRLGAHLHPRPRRRDVPGVPRARRAQPAARLRLQERALPRGHAGRPAHARLPVR
ncbi:MAG: ATP phosphoribosyltransferase regulatory subunit [Collinsella sp.]